MGNLNNTPLSQRKWDASANIYSSPTAYMSKDLVWAIQPKTNKLFFCVLNPDARIVLPKRWEIGQVHPLTSIFTEYLTPDLAKNFDVSSNTLSFKPNSKYLTGQGFSAILKDRVNSRACLIKKFYLERTQKLHGAKIIAMEFCV